jgi:hypothetical protein
MEILEQNDHSERLTGITSPRQTRKRCLNPNSWLLTVTAGKEKDDLHDA